MKMAAGTRRLWALLMALAALLPAARGVWMKMPSSGSKCVYEELRSHVVVMGTYFTFYGDGDGNHTVNPSVTVEVSSPAGTRLYHEEKVRYGEFAFTTNEPGYYTACFVVDNDDKSGKTVTVGLDWKVGIATKDWDSIAKKEKIEGLDLEMKKLQDYVQEIQEKMLHLMSRDLEMRVVSDRTNARVAKLSQASLGLCVLVTALQLWYLRRYFRKKKLI